MTFGCPERNVVGRVHACSLKFCLSALLNTHVSFDIIYIIVALIDDLMMPGEERSWKGPCMLIFLSTFLIVSFNIVTAR